MGTTFKKLMEKEDKSWYNNLLMRSSIPSTMKDSERSTIIDDCMKTSLDVKKRLIKEYGIMTARSYAKLLGLTVKEEDGDVVEGFLYMGLYQSAENTIIINNSTIDIIEKFIIDNKIEDTIPHNRIKETVLYHEIFHAMEDRIEGIYTRSKMIKKIHFGLFQSSRGLAAASEIGAIHFSKIMSEINFSPCIYERILLFKTDQSHKDSLQIL